MNDPTVLSRCERFVYDEAELLDRQHFERWLALFETDSAYWLPIDTTRREPHGGLNLVFDDRRRLEDRVSRFLSGFSHTEDPVSRTSQLLGNVRVVNPEEAATSFDWLPLGDADVVVSARTIITRLRRQVTDVLPGRVEWLLRPFGDSFVIRMKRIDLLHAQDPLPALTFLL